MDIAVIVIIALFTIRGAWIGLIQQLAFIAALVLAFLVAGAFSRQLVGAMKPLATSPQVNFLLVYCLLLLVVYVLVRLLGLALNKMMKVTMLGGFDRILGGVFGFAKGVFLATLLFMATAGVVSESAEFLRGSFSYPYLSTSAKALSWFIRDRDLRNRLQPKEAAISGLLDKAGAIIPGKTKEEPAPPPVQPPPAAPRYQPASRAGETPKK